MDIFTQRFSETVKLAGILPVVCLKSEHELDTLLDALLPTSIRCLEITLRHPFALLAIEKIKSKHPSLTVGAGTVNTVEKMRAAAAHGADFCVAPGFTHRLLETADTMGMPFLPGCATPSEILQMTEWGKTTLKLFPSECSGGVAALRLYAGAFADVSFLPTGGITMENLSDYLACPNVLACGGSFMIPKGALDRGDAVSIRQAVCDCLSIRERRRNT